MLLSLADDLDDNRIGAMCRSTSTVDVLLLLPTTVQLLTI